MSALAGVLALAFVILATSRDWGSALARLGIMQALSPRTRSWLGVVGIDVRRRRVRPRLALALAGLALAAGQGELCALVSRAAAWNSAFAVIVVAYGFVGIVTHKSFAADLAMTAARWIAPGSGESTASLAGTLSLVFVATLVTFFINLVVMSANATCAVVAPVFVPLLASRKIKSTFAAGAIMIGAWGGFLNPADTGGVVIAKTLGGAYSITGRHLVPSLAALLVCGLMLGYRAHRCRRVVDRWSPDAPAGLVGGEGRRALVLALPFAIMLLGELATWLSGAEGILGSGYRLALYMIVAVVVAGVTSPRPTEDNQLPGRGAPRWVRKNGGAFLAGAGAGLLDVVLLIMASQLFIGAFMGCFRASPLANHPVLVIAAVPVAFLVSLAIGSGDAVVSTMLAPVVSAGAAGVYVPRSALAAMIWLACEMGRSVSPISPAAIATAMQRPNTVDEDSVAREVTARGVTAVTLVPMIVALVVGCLFLVLSFRYL